MGGKGYKSNQSSGIILIFQKSCGEKDIKPLKVIECFLSLRIMKIMEEK